MEQTVRAFFTMNTVWCKLRLLLHSTHGRMKQSNVSVAFFTVSRNLHYELTQLFPRL